MKSLAMDGREFITVDLNKNERPYVV
jgi:hypothetical protein